MANNIHTFIYWILKLLKS